MALHQVLKKSTTKTRSIKTRTVPQKTIIVDHHPHPSDPPPLSVPTLVNPYARLITRPPPILQTLIRIQQWSKPEEEGLVPPITRGKTTKDQPNVRGLHPKEA